MRKVENRLESSDEHLPGVKLMDKDLVKLDPLSDERREKVKEAMLHAWNSYVTYAWGQDELQVVTS